MHYILIQYIEYIFNSLLLQQELLNHLHDMHREKIDNDVWNLEHMAIVNVREL